MRKQHENGNGFTIAELLIVIVIIGILAAIVVVAYHGVTRAANVAVLQNDLNSAQKQLQDDFVTDSDSYPDSLDDSNQGAGLQFTSQAQLQYTAHNESDPKSYCLTATINDISYFIQPGTAPTVGYCPEHDPNVAPDPPALATGSESQTQITVSWDAVGDPGTDDANQIAASYKLEYSTSSGFSGSSTIDNITGTSQVVSGLSPGTTYYFRGYSVGQTGTVSEASDAVSDDTVSAPPAGAPVASCTVNSATQITANWTSVPGSTSYTLQQSTSSTFSPLTTVPSLTGTSSARTGLSQGARYYFKLYSVGPGGNGPTSNAANCSTSITAPDSPTVTVTVPGATRAASSGPWAKTSSGAPTSGTYYYAQGVVSSSTCPTGTTRQARARIQYNDGSAFGAWTSYQTASTFYGIQPISGAAIKFQVTTRCYTSYATSSASSTGQGCRKAGNVAISCW